MPTSPNCKALPASGTWLSTSSDMATGVGAPAVRRRGSTDCDAACPDAAEFTNGIALTRFIDWAVTDNNHQPGDYSMLVLWGHAYRFAIGYTQTQVGIDALDFAELAAVLAGFQEKKRQDWNAPRRRGSTGGVDACSIATLEMARQLAPYAKYMIGSQVAFRYPDGPINGSLTGWQFRRTASWARRVSAASRCADTASIIARSIGPCPFAPLTSPHHHISAWPTCWREH